MKTSNPYGPGDNVKYTPATVTDAVAKGAGKAKATYKSGIPTTSQNSSNAGSGVKRRAYTPGGPTGS